MPKQGAETGFLEVAVGAECLVDPALRHDDERDAIGQRPFLVRALAEQLGASILQFCRGRYHFELCSLSEGAIELHEHGPIAAFGQGVSDFDDHILRGYHRRAQRLCPGYGALVALIFLSKKSQEVGGVGKDGHHHFLAVP